MQVRKFLFWAHLWVGLVTGLGVLILSITGMMLAFRPQILPQLEPQRVVAEQQGPKLSVLDIVDRVKEAYPKAKPRNIMVSNNPSEATSVNLGREEGTLFVNPYTGEVLGKEGSATAAFKKVEMVHRWFGLSGPLKPYGEWIKNGISFLFLMMIISGIYIGLPKFKGLRKWHYQLGLWGAPLLLALTITGLALVANDFVKKPPRKKVIGVMVKETNGIYTTFTRLAVDPKTGETLETTPVYWARFLHTGENAGLLGAILAFLGSGIAVFLVYSGYVMGFKRLKKQTKGDA